MAQEIARGGSAEWCSKCQLMVMPVGLLPKGKPPRWACMKCFTSTVPK